MYDNVLSRTSESIGSAVMPVCLTCFLFMVHYHITSSELQPITKEKIKERPSIYCSLLTQAIAVAAMCWYWVFAMWLHWHEDTMHSWECYANGLLVAAFMTLYRIALYSSLMLRVHESYKDHEYRASRSGLILFMTALMVLSGLNLLSLLLIDGHAEEGVCRYTVTNKVLGILTDVSMGMASSWFFVKPVWKLMKYNKVAKQLIVRQVVLNGVLVSFSVCPWIAGIVQDAYLDERLVSPYVMASLHMTLSTFCLVAMYPASLKAGDALIAMCCCCNCVGLDMYIEEIADLQEEVTRAATAIRKHSQKDNNNNNMKNEEDGLEMSATAGTRAENPRKQRNSVRDSFKGTRYFSRR